MSIYGAVYTRAPGDAKQKAQKPVRFSRLDIIRDGLNITELSTYQPRKHKAVANTGAGSAVLAGASMPQLLMDSTEIRKLETRDEYLYLELTDDRGKARKLWVEPVHFALEVPPKGPGARRFANQYTHLVAYTIGYDAAKLGKESLTFGERMKLAYEFASLGFETYSAVMNPMGAYDAYRSFRKVTQMVMQAQGRLAHRAGSGDLISFALPLQILPYP